MANNLYRKQKRQYSIDNGATWKDVVPLVYRVGELIEEDSNCNAEEGTIQYRWHIYDIKEQYTCDTTTYTKYNLELLQYSYDGINWENTTETRRGNQKEENSFDCGYIAYEYRDVEYFSGDSTTWICDTETFSKYKKKVKMYSNNGATWTKVIPEDAIKGDLIEEKSCDCGYYEFRWDVVEYKEDDSSTWICGDDHNKYKKEINQVKCGINGEWENTDPYEERKGDLIEEKTCDCGYYEYRWYTVPYDSGNSETWLCSDDYDKYEKEVYQVKCGINGEWGNTDPYEERFGNLIEEKTCDCGYYEYRWYTVPYDSENEDTWLCDEEFIKYEKEVYQVKCGINGEWENVDPYEERKGEIIEINSCDCGYKEYRWDLLPTDEYYHCEEDSFKSFAMEVYQIGCGDEWENVEPFTTRVTDQIIECFSTGCGMSSNEIELSLDDSNNNDYILELIYTDNDCDITGYYPTIQTNGQGKIKVNINDILPCEFSGVKLGNLKYSYDNNMTTYPSVIGIDKWFDTTYCTTFYGMFEKNRQYNLQYINTENIKTDNAITLNTMFQGCSGLTSLDINHFNTSKVTDMSYMFDGCSSLTSLDLSGWNTTNVYDMGGMFYGCSSLTSLDLSGWDFSKIGLDYDNCNYTIPQRGNIDEMFWNLKDCYINLQNTTYDLNNFILTSSASRPFSGCTNITLDLSGIDSAIVALWERMIGCNETVKIITDTEVNNSGYTLSCYINSYDSPNSASTKVRVNNELIELENYIVSNTNKNSATSLATIDLTDYAPITSLKFSDITSPYYGIFSIVSFPDTTNITDMSYMFRNTSCMKNIPYKMFNSIENVVDMSYFASGKTFIEVDLSYLTAPNLKNVQYMFFSSTMLENVNLSGWNCSVEEVSGMFYGCTNLKTINLSTWDLSNAEASNTYMLYNCPSLETIILNDVNCDTYKFIKRRLEIEGLENQVTIITNIDLEECYNINNNNIILKYNEGFNDNVSLSIGYDTIMLDKVETTDGMYYTTNYNGAPTTLQSIFYSARQLNEIVKFEINKSKVTNMKSAFYGCSSLTNLDLSGWGLYSLTNMAEMFSGCSGLTSLNLSNLDTTNVTDMEKTFSGCSSLTTLDINHFNTSNLLSTKNAFYGCSGLTSLDLSGWNTSKVFEISYMFYGCSNLTTINLSGWDMSKVKNMNYVFSECTSLNKIILGNVSQYDYNKIKTALDNSYLSNEVTIEYTIV